MKRLSRIERPDHRVDGFTLMEVLAAIFLTSIVITFAVSFYIDLANSSQRAIKRTREGIRATSVVDRVARDLSNAYLLARAEDTDPLSHPWFFVAESRTAFDGADLIKFNARSQPSGEGTYHRSDLSQIAYQVAESEDGSLTLYRWSSPGTPVNFEPGFPSIDDERSYIVAEGLESFSMRFLDEEGTWQPVWDSTQMVESGQLPIAIEIDLAMSNENEEEGWEQPPSRHFVRQIVLHQRPVDLKRMIAERDEAEAKAAGDTGRGGGLGGLGVDASGNPLGDGAGLTGNESFGGDAVAGSVAECTRRNWSQCVERYGEGNCGVWGNVTQVPVGAFGIDLPWCN